MNTIELTGILNKRIINGTNFLGVLACDQVPNHKGRDIFSTVLETLPTVSNFRRRYAITSMKTVQTSIIPRGRFRTTTLQPADSTVYFFFVSYPKRNSFYKNVKHV